MSQTWCAPGRGRWRQVTGGPPDCHPRVPWPPPWAASWCRAEIPPWTRVWFVHIEPTWLVGGTCGPVRTTLTPACIHTASGTLVEDHWRQAAPLSADAEHAGNGCFAVVLDFFVVFATTPKKCILSSRIILKACLIVIEDVVPADALQVWPDPLEEGPHRSWANFSPAPLNVGRLPNLHSVAPPLPEVSHPVLTWVVIHPSGVDIVFRTVWLD